MIPWRSEDAARTAFRCRAIGVMVAAMTTLLLVQYIQPTGASAIGAATWGPGFKRCGSFNAASSEIQVFTKDLSCAKARRIQKEFWLGPPSRKIVTYSEVGPPEEEVRLKRFPGWVCVPGPGGGSCVKGRHEAAYLAY